MTGQTVVLIVTILGVIEVVVSDSLAADVAISHALAMDVVVGDSLLAEASSSQSLTSDLSIALSAQCLASSSSSTVASAVVSASLIAAVGVDLSGPDCIASDESRYDLSVTASAVAGADIVEMTP